MPTYTFRGPNHDSGETTVEAPNEAEARQIAMCLRHGHDPDDIVPHAPAYKGLGLDLMEELP